MSQEQKMSKSDESTIKALYNLMKKSNAGNIHFVAHAPFGDAKAAAVFGVYNDECPAHLVLEKLQAWAEETGNTELEDKIQEFLGDMSFMNDVNISREA